MGKGGGYIVPPSSGLVPPVPPSQRCGLCQNFKQTTLTTRLYKVRTNLYPPTSVPDANRGRGTYLPEPPYLRETKTYHSQPFESIRHAGNYFVPISIRPIFIFFAEVTSNYLTTGGLKKISLLPEASRRPEARGICHICHTVNPALTHLRKRSDALAADVPYTNRPFGRPRRNTKRLSRS